MGIVRAWRGSEGEKGDCGNLRGDHVCQNRTVGISCNADDIDAGICHRLARRIPTLVSQALPQDCVPLGLVLLGGRRLRRSIPNAHNPVRMGGAGAMGALGYARHLALSSVGRADGRSENCFPGNQTEGHAVLVASCVLNSLV